MSLSERLRERKERLSHAKTRVRTPEGKVYEEEFIQGTHSLTSYEQSNEPFAPGYVIDARPDLQVMFGYDYENTVTRVLKPPRTFQVAEITPFLCMGSQDVAADLALLNSSGITHILNVGFGIPCFFPDKFTYEVIELLDVPPEAKEQEDSSSLQIVLGKSCDFINAAKDVRDAKVLVHCNAGVSRAATIVIGYLMTSERMRFSQAFEQVKAKRSCIRPNEGFLAFLKSIEAKVF